MGLPIVSVVMSTYNGERFLKEAIESVLSQTLRDFELLIVDDCSTDRTAHIIQSFEDPRIFCIKTGINSGYSAARNVGLKEARGKYIACMDHDDISLPDRLERQASFLESHPSIGLVACGYEVINEWGKPIYRNAWCADSFPVNEAVARKPYFIGPVYCFKRECIETVGLYRPGLDFMEDYDLCVRIAERYEVGMLGGISYKYRVHHRSSSFKKASKLTRGVILVRRLAEERRLTGTDRLSQLSEAKVRRFLRLYFYTYDRHESGFLPLLYLMYARICLLEGSWLAAAQYLTKGIRSNPLRTDTFRLAAQIFMDLREFKQLGSVKKI
jgi:glycosyltransferase involved in cell wall biosynthesis